jgi:hypothetical protein
VIAEAQFDRLLDFVDEVVEEELVQHSNGGVQYEQTEESDGTISACSSGSGSAKGRRVEQNDRLGACNLFASPLGLC